MNNMLTINLNELSDIYTVRKLDLNDAEMLYAFCKKNPQYYEYCGLEDSLEDIRRDLQICPPNTAKEQKYYIGFFEGETMMAVMDLIAGYPNEETAFIGFFMMNGDFQGLGLGSKIIEKALNALKNQGFARCRLAIDSGNPQAKHFWLKNGFCIVQEVRQENGRELLVSEKEL